MSETARDEESHDAPIPGAREVHHHRRQQACRLAQFPPLAPSADHGEEQAKAQKPRRDEVGEKADVGI